MAKYDTETKPALRALEQAALKRERRATEEGVGWSADLAPVKEAVDAAPAAGATPNEIAEAVGGRDAWNRLVRALRAAKLLD